MIDPNIVTGTFTILSGAIGYFAASRIASRNARIENQRQLRELGFRMALANFDFVGVTQLKLDRGLCSFCL
jgi:hypothetical protein